MPVVDTFSIATYEATTNKTLLITNERRYIKHENLMALKVTRDIANHFLSHILLCPKVPYIYPGPKLRIERVHGN